MKNHFRSFFACFGLFLLLSGIYFSCSINRKTNISELRCEYIGNPLGIDIAQPRFSWIIVDKNRGVSQSAYQILVSDEIEELRNGTGNVWDTKKTPSDKSNNIVYQGVPLKSNMKYYWSVCIWDQDGVQSSWSEPAFFHTGLFNASDWKGSWIESGDSTLEAPYFRKEFDINKKVKNAYIYVTGLGYYELYLNGEKVGDHVLDPAITEYKKRVLYSTYDVTGQVNNGANAVGILLGNGAFRLKKVEGRYSWGNGGRMSGPLCFLMQLNITYTDGSQATIVSDESWKSSGSPITFNNIYGGEDYDGRLEKEGWSLSGYPEKDWKGVLTAGAPGGVLQSQLMPPIKVTETIEPIASTNPEPGVYLFDLGQNIAGWWRIRIEGSEGSTVRIRGAETLNDSLFPKPLEPGDRLSTKHKYHSEVWTDYILNGNGIEVYEPRFFYTGFRYVELKIDNHKNPEYVKIEGRVVRSALEFNGRFITSDSLLNRIHRASLWSQMGNTHGFPTDCPHREKGGYTGDGQIIAEASIHDFNMPAYYTKWLNDMRDAQEENGRIPNTSPTLIGGHGGGIAWGSAYILIPMWMYQYYNDTRILEDHYKTMKRYLEYLHELAKTDTNPEEPYIINDFGTYWFSLGEWCAPGQSDCPNHPMVNTCYYYQNASLMSDIASLLGYKSDAMRYKELADTIRNELNIKFFNPETNLYGTENVYQTYQLLALATGIVPENHHEKVFQTVAEDIMKTRKGHLNTGIIGTKYLWSVMADYNHSDISHTVATQTTYPGFGYWIEKGSTTLLETWSGKNSHNHQMFGSVDEYFYKYLAGIRSPEDGNNSGGYKQIHIKPYVPAGLEFVDASLNTITGKVVSQWQQKKDIFQLRVVIPSNSAGTISIPLLDFKNIKVTESGKIVWEDGKFVTGLPEINDAVIGETYITFSIGSGSYEFKLTGDR